MIEVEVMSIVGNLGTVDVVDALLVSLGSGMLCQSDMRRGHVQRVDMAGHDEQQMRKWVQACSRALCDVGRLSLFLCSLYG
jgi:hypothetical protein